MLRYGLLPLCLGLRVWCFLGFGLLFWSCPGIIGVEVGLRTHPCLPDGSGVGHFSGPVPLPQLIPPPTPGLGCIMDIATHPSGISSAPGERFRWYIPRGFLPAGVLVMECDGKYRRSLPRCVFPCPHPGLSFLASLLFFRLWCSLSFDSQTVDSKIYEDLQS